MFLRGTA
ncbi:hypothetical protein CJF31_00003688 [Rutstroemia sp. NJR-2017a BVV2]|nr:hypothetical protein CJF31_00003688 [Rutstroemia sp. NJR-2017a BVV2]